MAGSTKQLVKEFVVMNKSVAKANFEMLLAAKAY